MISKALALSIHSKVIDEFGGIHGVRDNNGFESAINRPFQTFDSVDLYPTFEEKAAAILESIVKNHPFLDGNKRTAYVLMRFLLLQNFKDINATQQEKYDFVISVATSEIDFETSVEWIRKRMVESL
jgi:death on curing protein